MIKQISFNPTEIKILTLALNNDDRVQNHYSKEIFNCHYLSDYVSKLRDKFEKYFNNSNRNGIIETENRIITKSNGKKTPIGIYRISTKYKNEIRKLLNRVEKWEAT